MITSIAWEEKSDMLKSKLNRRAHAKLATRKKKYEQNSDANILSPNGVNDFVNDSNGPTRHSEGNAFNRTTSLTDREKQILDQVRNAPFILRTIHDEANQNKGHDYNSDSMSTTEKSEDTPVITNKGSVGKENIDPNCIQREWNSLPRYQTQQDTPKTKKVQIITPKKVQMKIKVTQQNDNNNILEPTNVNVDITKTYPFARATTAIESNLDPLRRRIIPDINDSLESSRSTLEDEDEGLIDRIEEMFMSGIEGIEDSFASLMPLCASKETGHSCVG